MRSGTGRTWARVAAAAASLGAGSFALADDVAAVRTGREGVLSLRPGDFPVEAMANLLDGAGPLPEYGVVHTGVMSAARRGAIEGAGVRLCGYLPTGFFAADLRGATRESLRGAGVGFVGAYRDEWKIDEALLVHPAARGFQGPERQKMSAAGQCAVRVWLFAGEGSAGLRAAVDKGGGRVIEEGVVHGGVTLSAVLAWERCAALAGAPGVQFVEELPEFTPRSNSTVRWSVQTTQTPSPNPHTPLYDNGLTGAGEVLGLIDGWLAYQHCAFIDTDHAIGPQHRKILAYNTAFGYSYHGTHVSGTAVGDAGDWSDTRGVAYGAKMVFNTHPSVSEPSVYDHFSLHRSQGACVHSDSWGNNLTTQYDGTCRAVDTIQWESPEQLILFAVADLTTIRNPENAKSVLAVTATGGWPNWNTMCQTTGAGPTIDGRRKPEIAAPGCSTISTAGETGCMLSSSSGTSMATPAVGGAAILARQYFTNGYYPVGTAHPARAFVPTGALLKAVMVNSGVDMTGVAGYPSLREGWGRVVADDALYFPGDARRLVVRDVWNNSAQALTSLQETTYRVHVDGALPLKITMAYSDVPALVGAAVATVNNLNLEVRSPSGALYYGNNFSNGESAPGGAPDAVNTVEQVHVNSPMEGDWVITVRAPAVYEGSQGYAIVVTGSVNDIPDCTGDYNQSGGTPDDADIAAFFGDWSAGTDRADVNRSGGTPDDADIAYFFLRWAAGC